VKVNNLGMYVGCQKNTLTLHGSNRRSGHLTRSNNNNNNHKIHKKTRNYLKDNIQTSTILTYVIVIIA
jgi:hypothetical protein